MWAAGRISGAPRARRGLAVGGKPRGSAGCGGRAEPDCLAVSAGVRPRSPWGCLRALACLPRPAPGRRPGTARGGGPTRTLPRARLVAGTGEAAGGRAPHAGGSAQPQPCGGCGRNNAPCLAAPGRDGPPMVASAWAPGVVGPGWAAFGPVAVPQNGQCTADPDAPPWTRWPALVAVGLCRGERGSTVAASGGGNPAARVDTAL